MAEKEVTSVNYARVSDRKQSEQDVSIPTQIEVGERRAAELGARVLRVFTDDAKSAWREKNRPAFEAAIDMACAMEATYFICWDSARFARNKYEAMINKRLLDDAGVQLIYISSPIDRATDMGWAMDGVMEIFNELQSRRISADTRRSMMRNARLGYWVGGRPPFGYQSVPAPDNPKRRKLVLVPDEVDLVQQLFAMRAKGQGAFQIAAWLNSRGILRRGAKWSKQTVINELRNEIMIGNIVFGRRGKTSRGVRDRDTWIIVPSHEAIIERPLWDQVQGLMDDAADITKAAGSPKSTHAFTGILHCGKCGSSMQIETSRGRGGKLYFYYRCRKSMQNRECDPRRIRADLVDDWLSNVILKRVLCRRNVASIVELMEAEAGNWATDHRKRRASVLAKITRLQEANNKLYSVLELYGKDAPNLGDMTTRLRQNNALQKEAEAVLVAIDAEQPPATAMTSGEIDELTGFLHNLVKDDRNAARSRSFYNSFVDSITLDGEELLISYNPNRLLTPNTDVVRSKRKWRPVLGLLRTISFRVTVPAELALVRGCPREVRASVG